MYCHCLIWVVFVFFTIKDVLMMPGFFQIFLGDCFFQPSVLFFSLQYFFLVFSTFFQSSVLSAQCVFSCTDYFWSSAPSCHEQYAQTWREETHHESSLQKQIQSKQTVGYICLMGLRIRILVTCYHLILLQRRRIKHTT